MLEIDKKQYKLLKYISRHSPITYASFSPEQQEICKYLLSKKMIRGITGYNPNAPKDVFQTTIFSYSITQLGMAQIYSFKSTLYKWWIPVIISIISLSLSAVAVICSILELLCEG